MSPTNSLAAGLPAAKDRISTGSSGESLGRELYGIGIDSCEHLRGMRDSRNFSGNERTETGEGGRNKTNRTGHCHGNFENSEPHSRTPAALDRY
jgi:hypothetical protein